jgi:hypothetical protein
MCVGVTKTEEERGLITQKAFVSSSIRRVTSFRHAIVVWPTEIVRAKTENYFHWVHSKYVMYKVRQKYVKLIFWTLSIFQIIK